MQHESEYAWVRDLPWLIVFGLLSSAYCVLAAGHIGATFDEPVSLLRGLEGWHLGGSGANDQNRYNAPAGRCDDIAAIRLGIVARPAF